MTPVDVGQDGREPGDELRPPGPSRFRKGVPRWIALLGCCALVFWSCLKLYDNQHAAAPSARRLLSLRASDRIAAVHELEGSGRVDTEVAIPALVRGLQNTDGEVRAAAGAATGLVSVVPGVGGDTGPSEKNIRATLMALINSLGDRQPSVRIAATRALWMVVLVAHVPAGTIDFDSAISALIERLDDSDLAIRVSAIQGLGAVASKALGEPPARLVAAIEDESDKSREAAIEALSNFRQGLPLVIPLLVRKAEVADTRIRAGYLKLLGRIRPPNFSGDAVPGLITALACKDKAIVAVAANDLLAFEVEGRTPAQIAARSAVPDLIAALISLIDRQGTDVRTSDPVYAIVEALGRLAPQTPSSEEAVAALVRVLRIGEGDTRRRVAAARALGRFRPGDALFTALTDTIEDKDFAVRRAAIGAIHDVEFGAPFVIPKTLGAALEDESAEVRTAAASALWRAGIGIDAYVPALLSHAERDPDARVGEVCAGTLQHVVHPRYVTPAVLPALIEALRVDETELKNEAIRALAEFGPVAAPASPQLIEIMKEARAKKHDLLEFRSAEALAKIGTKDVAASAIGTIRELGERGNVHVRSIAAMFLSDRKVVD
jgi:HEAT repeat protein